MITTSEVNNLIKFGGMKPGEYYIGEVVDREDPDEKYRLKVRIYPFWAEVEDAQLPWIVPLDISEHRVKNIPEKWAWCIFKGDQLQPMWVTEMLTSAGGDYSQIHKQVDSQIKTLGASSLSYPDFEIIKSGDVLVVYNTSSGEIVHVAGNSAIVMKKDGTVEIKNKSTSIELDSSGNVNINAGVGGSISLNGGTMGANDFPNCLFSGAPHCLDPLKSVKVP